MVRITNKLNDTAESLNNMATIAKEKKSYLAYSNNTPLITFSFFCITSTHSKS